ncbi:MAG: hypothetical protein CM15mP125_2180 [Gammaproteobacteria bacterium]|nr:MAG: hypothetical protein CM15mP125_2180 [Gammaproteobacteria bacterium]
MCATFLERNPGGIAMPKNPGAMGSAHFGINGIHVPRVPLYCDSQATAQKDIWCDPGPAPI